MKDTYEVVIIGGGLHGLSLAYNMAKKGMTDVLVLEKGYIGSGASGRNIELVRAMFSSTEWMALMKESLRLFKKLSSELNFNIMFTDKGYLILAKTKEQANICREAVPIQNSYGIDSRVIDAAGAKRLVPELNVEGVEGGMYQEDGGTAGHAGLIWGYSKAARELGVEICPFTEVTAIEKAGGNITGVRTSTGAVRTDFVINAAGGHASDICRMAGVAIPNTPHRIEACVTESLKPFMPCNVVSLQTHAAVTQTARGEVLDYVPTPLENNLSYSVRSSPDFMKAAAKALLDLFPKLRFVKIQRQWGGIIDMTPDRSPTLGPVDGLEGFVLDCGWGGYGFMSSPACGSMLSDFVVSGKLHPVVKSFNLSRFAEGRKIRDKCMVVE
jgi:sarcosine oxidase subunit beta